MSQSLPISRFRGTVIDFSGRDNGCTVITGWQRNVSRIRMMDVSLPTIITLKIDRKGVISSVELDPSFKGSRGLICSQIYLDARLKQLLTGRVLDLHFINYCRMKHLHCFHLLEVLAGIYSFYNMTLEKGSHNGSAMEEEVLDSYVINKDLNVGGICQNSDGSKTVYSLVFKDVLSRAGFNKAGELSRFDQVESIFSINDKQIFVKILNLEKKEAPYSQLFDFLFKCSLSIKSSLWPDTQVPYLNTNLFPQVGFSLLVQALAIHLFKNSYPYVMHVLRALQRIGNRPICIGGITDEKDAQRYFPEFRFADVLMKK